MATWLKVRTRHYRAMQVYNGSVYIDLKSISYRELDEADFTTWANAAREVVFTDLFPGLRDRERIEAELEAWNRWA